MTMAPPTAKSQDNQYRRPSEEAIHGNLTDAATATTRSTNTNEPTLSETPRDQQKPVSALEARRAKRAAESTTSTSSSQPINTAQTTLKPTSALVAESTEINTPSELTPKPISALEARRARKAAGSTETSTPSEPTPKPISALEARRARKAAGSMEVNTPSEPSKSVDDQVPSKPISALEARRAKKVAAAATETTIVEQLVDTTTIGPDRLPSRIYDSPSPPPISPVFPEINDEEDDNTDGFVTPLEQSDSEKDLDLDTEKDNEKDTLARKKEQEVEKNRFKELNKLLDPTAVSTYSPENVIAFEHDGETCYCIGFEKDQQLVFIGYALVGALYGSIDIGGATISSQQDISSTRPDNNQHTVSFFPVFSPRTSALMVVRSIPHESTSAKSCTELDSIFSDLGSVLEPFKSRMDKFESMVVIKSLEWCGADQLEAILPTFRNLFRLGNKNDLELNATSSYGSIAGFQPIVKVTPEVRSLKIEPSWSKGIDDVLKYEQDHSVPVPSVSIICGTKNAGKSSFARYMVNRLLKSHQRVAYLDTDVGQAEFTPSGLVSLYLIDTPLLGPPFTHPNLKPKRSFFIGSITPKNDPGYYRDCINELLRIYREEEAESDGDTSFYQSVPLVVNTHGWVKGLGYDLLFSLMDAVAPTHVFAFGCTPNSLPGHSLPANFTERVNMQQEQTSHPRRQLIPLEVSRMTFNHEQQLLALLSSQQQQHRQQPTTLSDRYQPIDYRNLMFMSYMYHDARTFGTKVEGRRSWWRTNMRLVDRLPWTVDWQQGLKSIWILFEDVPRTQLLYALNGSMVGLIGNVTDDPSTNKEQITPKYHSSMDSPPPNPSTTTCYGVGIVRSIDAEQHQIHLLTPLPFDQLSRVTSLVKGDLELPINCLFDRQNGSGYQICGIPRRRVPYISQDVINTVGSGASNVRRNLMRRSQQN
ncbi:Pre-mRNA cleavage complex II protein Clp1-domain-containing protein [Chlamydoabsidia padenii]|nr:Pre-mRNA cleavage complex II protein Clp1-domain-containing protein [Chlamydoabsidia padenii]